MSGDKYMSPELFAGLHHHTQCYIRSRSRYETGELSLIMDSTCKIFNVSIEDLKHPNRRADLNDARKIFFHLARRLYLFTNEKLGRYLGRDHSTVVVAVQKCEVYLESDPRFKELYVNTLLETIRNLKINGYENYNNAHKQIVFMTEVMELNKIKNGYRSDYDVRS